MCAEYGLLQIQRSHHTVLQHAQNKSPPSHSIHKSVEASAGLDIDSQSDALVDEDRFQLHLYFIAGYLGTNPSGFQTKYIPNVPTHIK